MSYIFVQGEETFEGDKLLDGGSKSGLKNGKDYKEVRRYTREGTVITYYFVTRVYGEYMKSIVATFENEPPDVLIMNSCLWDLSRYGNNANTEFKTNVNELLTAIDLVMPYNSKRVFIWNASLPVVDSTRPFNCFPFLSPIGVRPENTNVRNANLYVRDQMANCGEHFIFLDLYDVFYRHLDHRNHDGVHWDSFAHRKITHLILTAVSARWDFQLATKQRATGLPGPRGSIRPQLTSIPLIGGCRSLGFPPNHSTPPYQRATSGATNVFSHSKSHSTASQYQSLSPKASNVNNKSQSLSTTFLYQSSFPRTINNLENHSQNHVSSFPRANNMGGHCQQKLLNALQAHMFRKSLLGQGENIPMPGFQFACNRFPPRPWHSMFAARPYLNRRPLNVCNGALPDVGVNVLPKNAFSSALQKRKFEEDELHLTEKNEYKRPRKFL